MFTHTLTFQHIDPRPGFVSAWDAAERNYDRQFGLGSFASLRRAIQINEVRIYIGR